MSLLLYCHCNFPAVVPFWPRFVIPGSSTMPVRSFLRLPSRISKANAIHSLFLPGLFTFSVQAEYNNKPYHVYVPWTFAVAATTFSLASWVFEVRVVAPTWSLSQPPCRRPVEVTAVNVVPRETFLVSWKDREGPFSPDLLIWAIVLIRLCRTFTRMWLRGPGTWFF